MYQINLTQKTHKIYNRHTLPFFQQKSKQDRKRENGREGEKTNWMEMKQGEEVTGRGNKENHSVQTI